MKKYMDAWKVNEKDFPRTGSDADKLAFCLRYAILAPSTYNSQPWRFAIKGSTVSVYADRRYGLPVIDPDDRELCMACAAAIYNLRLAIRYFGFTETTEMLPEEENPDLLARVTIGASADPSELDRVLFRAVTKRHINRGTFSDKDVPEDDLKKLKSAVSEYGSWLHICTPAEQKMIIRLVTEADHIQTASKQFRRELASWIHPMREISGDGMPSASARYRAVMESMEPSSVRRFETNEHTPANDLQLMEGSPTIVILGARAGGDLQRLQTGQALERFLLEAETLGLSVSTLNQPCEVPELRLRLHDEVHHKGRAHFIMRVGYGGKPNYTPRRPLEAVLDMDGQAGTAANAYAANDTAKGRSSGNGFIGKVCGLFRR